MSTVKVSELIIKLAERAGVKIDTKDPEMIGLLSLTTELPESITDAMYTNLMSSESAIANPKVRGVITKAILEPIDKDILKYAEALGLPNIEELRNETYSRERMQKLIAGMEELGKKTDKGGIDKDTYDKEVQRLNDDAKKLRTDFENEKSNILTENEKKIIDLLVENNLGGYQYAESPYGNDFVQKYAKDSLLQSVNKLGGKFVLDGKTVKLVKADTGGDLFSDKNEKVEFKTLLDSTVAPMLKKQEATPPRQTEIELGGGANKAIDAVAGDKLVQLANEILAA